MSELPRAASIREVGPRDGFQNEPEVIPTERKIELIDALARTGVRRLEVTSFVRADVIPQLADAADVLAGIDVNDRGQLLHFETLRIDGVNGSLVADDLRQVQANRVEV